jgi:NitT/TauT family transport system ATP-binding protein
MENNRPFLRAERVSHTFPDGMTAIADISLKIKPGAFVALVGTSGVGKSTLLRVLAGLLEPTAVQVAMNGSSAGELREPTGIVFQKDNLMPWRTVVDNIRLPLELQGTSKAGAQGTVQKMVELVGLSGFENSYPAQLSGGMAQRVALARALIHKPKLLLLDEPFGGLDALTRERMGQELLRIWNAMPVTVFMVTHSILESVLLADQVLVMTGPPGRLTERIPVDLPRPRALEIQVTPEFQRIATKVRTAIAQEWRQG